MDWVGIILVVLVIFYLIGKAQPSGKRKSSSPKNPKPKQSIDEAAQEIADKIKTPKGVDGLDDRIDKACERLQELETEKSIASQERKLEILERARDIVDQKTFAYQYIPYLSLLSPVEKIEKAFKRFKIEEYQELVESLDPKESHWLELDRYMDYEEIDNPTKGLKKFRQILDSEIEEDEKWKKIKQLIDRNEEFREEFFCDPDISPQDHYEIAKLKEQGIPFVDQLFSEGFTKVEDYLNLKPDEFVKRKGIGPKKKQLLIEFQKNFAS